MEASEITKSQLSLEQFTQIKTSQSFRQEVEYLRLKSQSLWLQARDKNLAFFHRQCKARFSLNYISEISIGEGEIIKGHEHLKQDAKRNFQQLFHEDGNSDSEVFADFLANIPSLVSPECNVRLMKPFSEIEILDVIWTMEPDKAPGSNGFSFHFYRAYWKIIKTNLIHMVIAFQEKGKSGRMYELYFS